MRWLGLTALGALLASAQAWAEKCPNMLIILDRSGSMAGFKWTTAIQAINSFVPQRQSVMRFGLVVFPAFVGDSCSGGTVEVPCDFYTGSAIAQSLELMGKPGGYTPTAATLDQAAALPAMTDSSRRRFIILLTDGDPTCPDMNNVEGNLQAVEKSLSNLLAGGIKTFVIGFGQEVVPARLDRMATAGGTPRANASCADPADATHQIPCKYYDASDLATLNAAFDEIATLAQGELTGNSCDDSCYQIGGCPAGQRCTQKVQTYDGGKYSLNLGQCVSDPCAGFQCSANQFCRDGACVNACMAPCGSGEYCLNGRCVTDSCADPSACSCSQSCAKYLICLNGACADDPCRYTTCPASAPYCDRGNCYAATAPRQAQTQQPASEQPGSTQSGQRARGGCSSAGPGAPALGLLPVIPLVLRRRRRPARLAAGP